MYTAQFLYFMFSVLFDILISRLPIPQFYESYCIVYVYRHFKRFTKTSINYKKKIKDIFDKIYIF